MERADHNLTKRKMDYEDASVLLKDKRDKRWRRWSQAKSTTKNGNTTRSKELRTFRNKPGRWWWRRDLWRRGGTADGPNQTFSRVRHGGDTVMTCARGIGGTSPVLEGHVTADRSSRWALDCQHLNCLPVNIQTDPPRMKWWRFTVQQAKRATASR